MMILSESISCNQTTYEFPVEQVEHAYYAHVPSTFEELFLSALQFACPMVVSRTSKMKLCYESL